MKQYSFSNLLILLIIIGISSCKPIYKCGEAKPTKKMFFVPKIYQTVINERDSLCSSLSDRNTEVASLKMDTTKLGGNIRDLQKKLQDITDLSDTKSKQYTTALKQKSDELAQKSKELVEKEKLLSEREKSLNEMKKLIARQDSLTKKLNNTIRDALLGFNSDELTIDNKNGKVYVSLSDKLLFKSGSATVESKGQEAIKLLAGIMNKNKDIDILIEGHTDNIPIKTPIYKDNWDLSAARAISIVRILTEEYKVSPIRLTASGKGEYSPKVSNSTAEGRAKNRRTEIILSPKLDEIMKLLGNK